MTKNANLELTCVAADVFQTQSGAFFPSDRMASDVAGYDWPRKKIRYLSALVVVSIEYLETKARLKLYYLSRLL